MNGPNNVLQFAHRAIIIIGDPQQNAKVLCGAASCAFLNFIGIAFHFEKRSFHMQQVNISLRINW